MPKVHRTTQYIVKPADPENDFPNALLGDAEGDEFDDTDALFSPGVLGCYPKIPPFPGASYYAVGYGSLVACNEREEQIAVWQGVKVGWEAD